MTKDERELIEEKFKGLHLVLELWQDGQHRKDVLFNEKLDEAISLQKVTNGRVTRLEEREKTHYIACPNIKTIEDYEKRARFWFWFTDKPIRLAIFFLIPIILIYLLSVENVFMLLKQFVNML